jgi:hypothetical protein
MRRHPRGALHSRCRVRAAREATAGGASERRGVAARAVLGVWRAATRAAPGSGRPEAHDSPSSARGHRAAARGGETRHVEAVRVDAVQLVAVAHQQQAAPLRLL